jgi:hypothetical protein
MVGCGAGVSEGNPQQEPKQQHLGQVPRWPWPPPEQPTSGQAGGRRTPLGSCGQALDFLHRKGVLTEKMKDYAKALYGVLSDEGVHALKSEQVYVRLCRFTVAEYALVLFFELDRRLQE